MLLIIAAKITKMGASVMLKVLDRTGFISAGYEGIITGLEAYQAGAPPGVAMLRGAIQAALEKVPLIKDEAGIAAVTGMMNECYKQIGETLADILTIASREPKPSAAELRRLAGRSS